MLELLMLIRIVGVFVVGCHDLLCSDCSFLFSSENYEKLETERMIDDRAATTPKKKLCTFNCHSLQNQIEPTALQSFLNSVNLTFKPIYKESKRKMPFFSD